MSDTSGVEWTRVPGSPVGWSLTLGRRLRDDDLDTLGRSSLDLAIEAGARGEFAVAEDLMVYFHDECRRMVDAVGLWAGTIIEYRLTALGVDREVAGRDGTAYVMALLDFPAASGDLEQVTAACAVRDLESLKRFAESLRIRAAVVHDQLVWWTQRLLEHVAAEEGETAVRDAILWTYEVLWAKRYETWPEMDPEERLRLSVEGMRGHLSGLDRHGTVRVEEFDDYYILDNDPCGSCGVLRRGDPDSGRRSCEPKGPSTPHDWAYMRTDIGWYALHSAIVMEWVQITRGMPPLRPQGSCDRLAGPCTWYVYKDSAKAIPREPAMLRYQRSQMA